MTTAVCAATLMAWGVVIASAADGVTTHRAVIVGIADYVGIWNDLDYCADDARDFRDALLAGSNWDSANIELVVDRQATAANIWAALNRMAAAADSDDLCLFFFSGHGTTDTDVAPIDEGGGDDEFLCESDLENDIRDDELGQWAAGLPTQKLIVVLCACHSGGFIKGTLTAKGLGRGDPPGTPRDSFADDLRRAMAARDTMGPRDLDDNGYGVVITAADDDETCAEDPALEHDVLNYYLLEGMAGPADANSDDWVTAEEIYAYAGPRATQFNSGQHAQLYDAQPAVAFEYLNLGGTPPPHTITITGGPAGIPNPVASGGQVQCSAAAQDGLGHNVTYQWTAEDGAGSFDNATAQNPTWTAPTLAPDQSVEYTMTVTATCSQDASVSASASYTQRVTSQHEVIITAGPAGDPDPVASTGDVQVQCAVTAEDTRGHDLTYQWTAQGGAGSFDDATAQNPKWTAPAVGSARDYTIAVTVTCSENAGVSASPSFEQRVFPAFRHTFPEGLRTLGVPLDIIFGGSMEALLGASGVARWDAAGQAYITETTPSGICALGEGCWARFASQQQAQIPGAPYAQTQFTAAAKAGWNLMALPWNENLSIAAMSSDPAGQMPQIAWAYYGGDYHLVAPIQGLVGVTSQLTAWRGYWTFAHSDCSLILDQSAAVAGVEPMSVGDPAQAGRDDVWVIQLVASAGGALDSANYCGVSPRGDALDVPNPPAAHGAVDLCFTSAAGSPKALDFCAEQPGPAYEWEFEVSSAAVGQQVTVAWPDLSSVPGNCKVRLTDRDADKTVNMRTTARYEYRASSEAPRHFLLQVTEGAGQPVLITGVVAQQVNAGRMTISYTLSADAEVSIRAYNIAGRCIRCIAYARPSAAGLRTAAWDLRGEAGSEVPSGHYLVRITARADDGAEVSALGDMTVRR